MLLDVAVAAIAKGGGVDLLRLLNSFLTLDLATDELKCVHEV